MYKALLIRALATLVVLWPLDGRGYPSGRGGRGGGPPGGARAGGGGLSMSRSETFNRRSPGGPQFSPRASAGQAPGAPGAGNRFAQPGGAISAAPGGAPRQGAATAGRATGGRAGQATAARRDGQPAGLDRRTLGSARTRDQLNDFLSLGAGVQGGSAQRAFSPPRAEGGVQGAREGERATNTTQGWQQRRSQLQQNRQASAEQLPANRRDVAADRQNWADGIHENWHDQINNGYHNWNTAWWGNRYWAVAGWPGVNGWFSGWWATPVYYDYGAGGNVYIDDGTAYVQGQPTGLAEDYGSGAIAQAGAGASALDAMPAPEVDDPQNWLPLGVFAISTSREDANPIHLVQLAVNKQGVVAGTYLNTAKEETRPVQGRVDRKTQRVAFTVGDKKDTVVETGIYNLTQDEAPALVHFGTERTEQWLLVRLEEPKPAGSAQ